MNEMKAKTSEKTEAAKTFAARASTQVPAPSPLQSSFALTDLQQVAGNLAMQRFLHAGAIQAKLTVSSPGDMYEQEADRVTEQVVSSAPTGTIQRKCEACATGGTTCPKCEEEEKGRRKEKPGHSPQATPDLHSQVAALQGGGQPLPLTSEACLRLPHALSTSLLNQRATWQASGRVTSRRVAAIMWQEVEPGSHTRVASAAGLLADVGPVPLGFGPVIPIPLPPLLMPVFDHSSGKTVTINADTAQEFAQNITATIGSPHTQPVFEPDIQFAIDTDAAGREVPDSRKITSIRLKVKTAITTVRFGVGKPNDKHKKAIDEMVAAIKEHEEKHRTIIEHDAILALWDAQKFVGTGKTKEANKALTTDLECVTNKKHEALDAVEGLLTPLEQQDGSVKVTKTSSGAKYPCP